METKSLYDVHLSFDCIVNSFVFPVDVRQNLNHVNLCVRLCVFDLFSQALDLFSQVKHNYIRVLLAMVAKLNLELEQLDANTMFLRGELDEQIYMHQLEGFEIHRNEDHVCLLKKQLYGLKQSLSQWYKHFDTFIVGNGYCRSAYNNCVYHKKHSNGSYVYLLLYVDDMLIAVKDMSQINRLKTQLSGEFEMKDLSAAKKILGVEIRRDRKAGKLSLS